MFQTIPLIRAANVLPLVRWMETNRVNSATYLEKADLGYWFALSPLDAIPTLNAAQLLRDLARDHGADLGIQVVTQASMAELGFIGGVALGARTPMEAMQRLAFAMPYHSSHEALRIETNADQVTICLSNTLALDAESNHAVHVLFSALIQQLCRFTGLRSPVLKHIEMTAHPEGGLAHVAPLAYDGVTASDRPAIKITIDASVANNPFRTVARDRSKTAAARQIPPLQDEQGLAASLRPIIAAMLHGGQPSVARVARASGTSVRSLQRRLEQDGTNFSEQLELVRRQLVMAHLEEGNVKLADLSERLGYTEQSALTRAVRRLTGHSPSELKADHLV